MIMSNLVSHLLKRMVSLVLTKSNIYYCFYRNRLQCLFQGSDLEGNTPPTQKWMTLLRKDVRKLNFCLASQAEHKKKY